MQESLEDVKPALGKIPSMLTYLDYPPVWLLAALGVVWSETLLMPDVLSVPGGWIVGTGFVVLAILLFFAAGVAFFRARTTIVPHQMPHKLITSGIFSLTRNPIYLADVLLLIGMSLRWGAVLGLLLAPVLVWVLHKRFIKPEEERLRQGFGPEAEAYFARTRRWI